MAKPGETISVYWKTCPTRTSSSWWASSRYWGYLNGYIGLFDSKSDDRRAYLSNKGWLTGSIVRFHTNGGGSDWDGSTTLRIPSNTTPNSKFIVKIFDRWSAGGFQIGSDVDITVKGLTRKAVT